MAAMQGTRTRYDLVDVQAPGVVNLIGSAASLHIASLISPDFVLALPSRISDSGTFRVRRQRPHCQLLRGISPLKNALAYSATSDRNRRLLPEYRLANLGRAANDDQATRLTAAHDALKVCIRHRPEGHGATGRVDRFTAVASASAKAEPVVAPRSASSAMRACASAISYHQRRCQPGIKLRDFPAPTAANHAQLPARSRTIVAYRAALAELRNCVLQRTDVRQTTDVVQLVRYSMPR